MFLYMYVVHCVAKVYAVWPVSTGGGIEGGRRATFQYLNVLWANAQFGHFLNPKQTLHHIYNSEALAQNRGFLALFEFAESYVKLGKAKFCIP